jgi:hypothetical protein
MKYKWISVLLFVFCYGTLSAAHAGARLSIVKGGDKPSWINLSKHVKANPMTLPINGYGDWTHCEAYAKPDMASAFVRCFTHPNRGGASIGAYCDLDTNTAWKKPKEWIRKSEFHLDAGKSAAGWVTVTLDCSDE